jgi:hypothetical protein
MPEGIEYLVKVGTEAAAKATQGPVVNDSYYNDSYHVVANVEDELAKYPDAAALPFLRQMLKHPNSMVRAQAVVALASMPKPEFADTFRRYLLGDAEQTYDALRFAAARGLARLGDEKTYGLIHEALVQYEKDHPNDWWFLSRLAASYNELTAVLQARRPDFKPPEFVEQDRQRIQAILDRSNGRQPASAVAPAK